MKAFKIKNLVLIVLFLIVATASHQSNAQENYYVISVQEKIFINQKPLKAKDKISAKAMIKFSSHDAKAIIFSPAEGKFVLNATKLEENRKGELIAPIEEVITPMTEYYYTGTRAGDEMTAEDFGTSIHDNPVDSDLITVYFIGQEPNFAFPVPANLLRKDAQFYLKSPKHTISVPIKNGKLIFSKQMLDDKGKSIDVLKTKDQFEFIYNRTAPPAQNVIGKVVFELF